MSRSFDRRRLLAAGLATITFSWTASPTLADVVPPFGTPQALPDIAPRTDDPLDVVTSTSILADLVRQLGGERVKVSSILPANADPHDFEPAPDDVIAIESADLIVTHGLELDDWIGPLIDASGSTVPVVVATDGVPTIGSDDEHFSQGDPHVWFDPMRVKIMIENIRAGLVSVDPDGQAGYEARQTAYDRTLDDLDAEISARIALVPVERRILATNHDSLAYYADRYELTIIGTVIPGLDTRVEPSAQEVAALIEALRASGVTVIFAENTVSPALAESLARDAGIRVAPELYTDSLGTPESGADTYIGLMQVDTMIIVENLLA